MMKPFKMTRNEILKNPREAAEYLNTVMEECDTTMFKAALLNVAEAKGGFRRLMEKSKLNRRNLRKLFSERSNLGIQNLEMLLETLGLRLRIEVLRKTKVKKAA